MREDQLESLDTLFPGGYLIVHIQQNGTSKFSWFNPENNTLINQATLALIDRCEEENINDSGGA